MPTEIRPRLFAQPSADVMRELAQDLDAAWDPASRPGDPASWITRPTLLRRVARLLAEEVDEPVSRLIGTGDGGEILATAVALATGLPFASLDEAGRMSGVIHDGDVVAMLAVSAEPQAGLADLMTTAGARIHSRLAVLGSGALFIDAAGSIQPEGAREG